MPPAPSDTEHIRLSLPARHEYARIARIAVAALALRLGFSYREVQDLRLAIDESLVLLLGADRPDERVTLRFSTQPGHMEIHATAEFDPEPGDEALERFSTLVAELVDSWHVADAGDTIRLRKEHQANPED